MFSPRVPAVAASQPQDIFARREEVVGREFNRPALVGNYYVLINEEGKYESHTGDGKSIVRSKGTDKFYPKAYVVVPKSSSVPVSIAARTHDDFVLPVKANIGLKIDSEADAETLVRHFTGKAIASKDLASIIESGTAIGSSVSNYVKSIGDNVLFGKEGEVAKVIGECLVPPAGPASPPHVAGALPLNPLAKYGLSLSKVGVTFDHISTAFDVWRKYMEKELNYADSFGFPEKIPMNDVCIAACLSYLLILAQEKNNTVIEERKKTLNAMLDGSYDYTYEDTGGERRTQGQILPADSDLIKKDTAKYLENPYAQFLLGMSELLQGDAEEDKIKSDKSYTAAEIHFTAGLNIVRDGMALNYNGWAKSRLGSFEGALSDMREAAKAGYMPLRDSLQEQMIKDMETASNRRSISPKK